MAGQARAAFTATGATFAVTDDNGATWSFVNGMQGMTITPKERSETTAETWDGGRTIAGSVQKGFTLEIEVVASVLDKSMVLIRKAADTPSKIGIRFYTAESVAFNATDASYTFAIATDGGITFAGLVPSSLKAQVSVGWAIKKGSTFYPIRYCDSAGKFFTDTRSTAVTATATYSIVIPSLKYELPTGIDVTRVGSITLSGGDMMRDTIAFLSSVTLPEPTIRSD